jgi:catechol 2,3-dioxygenase-like lactoylglutathione lyase family enzyme
MTSRLVAVALDCRDPEALAAFWCAALGYRVRERWSDAAGTGYVETGDGDGVVLLFQPVREDKAVKNRLHLDVAPVQGSQVDEVTRLVGLGASMLDDDSALPWVVLADPEASVDMRRFNRDDDSAGSGLLPDLHGQGGRRDQRGGPAS